MLNLSYLDMCHLMDVLKKDSAVRTDSIIANLQTELNRTPHAMVPACLSPCSQPDPHQDIYYLNTEGIIQFLRRRLQDHSAANTRVLVMAEDAETAAELVYKLIRYVDSGKVDPMKTGRLVCANGMVIDVITRKQVDTRARGFRYALGIIHTF
jgi:hypothetical protein